MSHRETVVACDDCGAARIAFIGDNGNVSVNGESGCRRCGSEEFAELTDPTGTGA